MEIHFSTWQFFRLWFMYSVASVSFMLQTMFQTAKYDAWIDIIIAILGGICLSYFSIRLMQLHPNKNWIDYGKTLIGKWGHKIFICLILIFCILTSAISMQQYSNLLVAVYFEDTPDYLFTIVFLLCISFLIGFGLKSVIYMSDILFLLFVTIIIMASFFTVKSPYLDYSMTQMLLHVDWRNIGYSSLYILNWSGDIILFLFFAHRFTFKKKKKSPFITLLATIFVSGFNLFNSWYLVFIEFGYHLPQNLRYPDMELLRIISPGGFLDNIDIIPFIFLPCTLLIKLGILIYIANKFFIHAFQIQQKTIKKLSPFIIVFIVIMICFYFSNRIVFFNYFSTSIYYQEFLLFIKFIPFIYFVLYKIRSLKNSQVRTTR